MSYFVLLLSHSAYFLISIKQLLCGKPPVVNIRTIQQIAQHIEHREGGTGVKEGRLDEQQEEGLRTYE